MCVLQKLTSVVSLVLIIVVYLDAVTVNPSLCPTNKIAPHRSAASLREDSEGRTLGLILGLNNQNRPRPPYYSNNVNNLQEQPQEDDPDDCGDIDDYDETDLSSITRPTQNYVYNKRGHRQTVDGGYNPSNYQDINRYGPYRPQRPVQPQRPQYYPPQPHNPGGQYGFHRPPYQNRPSGPYKPVHENTHEEPQGTYRPGLVGGVLGQVVGFPPVIPTSSSDRFKKPNRYNRLPENDSYNKRNPRDRQPNVASDIIGSFVDLLFN